MYKPEGNKSYQNVFYMSVSIRSWLISKNKLALVLRLFCDTAWRHAVMMS